MIKQWNYYEIIIILIEFWTLITHFDYKDNRNFGK
jgi:hypothetical protein